MNVLNWEASKNAGIGSQWAELRVAFHALDEFLNQHAEQILDRIPSEA